MNKKCAVVVLTCDSYSDLWDPFFILKNRYWADCPYETYLITETKKCDYCKTINVNESIWTKRVREGLKKIKSDYVIILLEDFFIRDKVNNERIEYCMNNFDENTAMFNFEKSHDVNDIKSEVEGFNIKTRDSKYKCSSQAAIWDKEKLIELLSKDCDPWTWETNEPLKNYKFYINNESEVFTYGKENILFGVYQGKWYKADVVPLFKKENIKIDYSVRGFYKKDSIFKRMIRKIKRLCKKHENK